MVYIFCHHDLNDTILLYYHDYPKGNFSTTRAVSVFLLNEDGQTIARHACLENVIISNWDAEHEQQVLVVRTTQQLNDNTTKDKTTMVVIVVADLIYNN